MHRVRAGRAAAAELTRRGAVVLQDYGAFQLLNASADALATLPADADVELRDDDLRIHLNSGDLDTSSRRAAALAALSVQDADAATLHLLQFAGPVRTEWRASVEAAGLRVVGYVPSNAYLVYGPARTLWALETASGDALQFASPYGADLKIDAALARLTPSGYRVQLVEDAAVNRETVALATSLAGEAPQIQRALGFVNLTVKMPPSAVPTLAARPDVVSVQGWTARKLLDERQDMVLAGPLSGGGPAGPGYLDWLASKGFNQAQFDASGFGVDLSDTGLDNGTTEPDHPGLYRLGDGSGQSRVAYVRLEGSPQPGGSLQGCDGHGTLNSHIVGGYSAMSGAPFADAAGFRYGLGVAPFVRLGNSVVFEGERFTGPSYEDLQSRAYRDGMRISSNSWGASINSYDDDAQRYDALVRDAQPDGAAVSAPGNQEMVIVFSAGNDGPDARSLGTPGLAKNVISVGAGQGVQPFGGADGCDIADDGASNALALASFSSRGPTGDGRRKPDLIAPGTHISGGIAQAPGQRTSPPAIALGRAIACFDGTGMCGGVSSPFFPAGQEWYGASSGTSHSCPAVAGAAALLRQWFLNQALPPPSPAMTKAYLASSARYMTGVGDSLLSSNQGMGLVDLGAALDDTPRTLRDQEPEDLFTATGQTRSFTGSIGDPTRPFRVTLAFTDAPGSTAGAAWANDLDLAVEVGGRLYRGNVFDGATSVPGGAADAADNLESVFLPAGTSGLFTVTVTAANVTADGVPGNASLLDQDFALVITNTCGAPPPAVPGGVQVSTAGDNALAVSWTPVAGAESYQVFRAPTADGQWTRVASVTAPPFVDTGRSGGTPYFYEVRAQAGCALSGVSAVVRGMAAGRCLLPPAFAGLRSAESSGQAACGVELAWAPATPACGGSIHYEVYRSTEPGFVPGPVTRLTSAVEPHAFDGTPAGGTVYHYVVRAVETSGGLDIADGNAVERTATPMVQVLFDDFDQHRPTGADALWQALAPYGGQVVLHPERDCHYQSPSTSYRWGAWGCGDYPADNYNRLVLGGTQGISLPAGLPARLSFRLWYDLSQGYDYAWLGYSTTGPSGSFAHIGAEPSTRVPYIEEGGYDPEPWRAPWPAWSGRNAGPDGDLQRVRVNLDALAGQRVWLAWSFTSYDYPYGYATGAGASIDDVALDLGGASCQACSDPVPPPPAELTALVTGPSSVRLDWASAAVSGYEVSRATALEGPYVAVGEVAAPPFVDTGRSGGTRYFYAVRARQGCAVSEPATTSTVAEGPCQEPPRFAGLRRASSSGDITCGISLSWEAATPSCGGTVTYDVFRGPPGFGPDATNRILTGVTATSITDAGGLTSGADYVYVVRAVEAVDGRGPVSDENLVSRAAAPAYGGGDFFDDLDAHRPAWPADWWRESAHSTLVSGCVWQSANSAYRIGPQGRTCDAYADFPAGADERLVLGGDGSGSAAGLPIRLQGAQLSFYVWYDLWSGRDGLSLQYSTVGADGPFLPVPASPSLVDPYIIEGAYDGTIASGQPAWTGSQGAGWSGRLRRVTVNLDPIVGRTVWFAWALHLGPNAYSRGAYVDDVRLTGNTGGCSTTPVSSEGPVLLRADLPTAVTAGETATVTWRAEDQYGRTVTSYAGTAVVTSTDPAAVLPGSITFSGGVASGEVQLRTAGVQSVTAEDVEVGAMRGTSRTSVSPAAAQGFRWDVQPQDVFAGEYIAPAPVIVVVDAFGNLTPAWPGQITLSLVDPAEDELLQGVGYSTPSGGRASFPYVSLYRRAGPHRLLASAPGLESAQSDVFQLRPGTASSLDVVTEPGSARAGEPFSPAISFVAVDVYGNPTTATGSAELGIVEGPSGAALHGSAPVWTNDGTVTFDGVWADVAGGYLLSAQLSTFPGLLRSQAAYLVVSPGDPAAAILLDTPSGARAGLPFDEPLRAQLMDAFGNPCQDAVGPRLSLALSPGTSALLLGELAADPAYGVATFGPVGVDRPGTYTLQVKGDGLAGDDGEPFQVQAGPVTQFLVSGPAQLAPGEVGSYVLAAADADGAVQPTYLGAATLSGDGTMDVPAGAIGFTNGNSDPVVVGFHQPGVHVLAAADAGNTGVQGSLSVSVQASGSERGGGGGCQSGGGEGGLLALVLLLAVRVVLRARASRLISPGPDL